MIFTKMHGLGNDFIVVEDFSFAVKDCAQLAVRLCDRHFGIGADGLALLQPSQKGLCRIRIFNADGSEAEMCGNLIRCVGKYLFEHGFTDQQVIGVEMGDALKTLRMSVREDIVVSVEVDMGEPVLDSLLIPVKGKARQVIGEPILSCGNTFLITAVSMGNPHCVIFVDSISNVPLSVWGPQLEMHPLFPKKTNVEFVEIVSPVEARFLVWERGAGPTLACGSGACAVLVASVLSGKLNKKATLHLPGGSLFVEWRADHHLYMTGPAEEVFCGEINI